MYNGLKSFLFVAALIKLQSWLQMLQLQLCLKTFYEKYLSTQIENKCNDTICMQHTHKHMKITWAKYSHQYSTYEFLVLFLPWDQLWQNWLETSLHLCMMNLSTSFDHCTKPGILHRLDAFQVQLKWHYWPSLNSARKVILNGDAGCRWWQPIGRLITQVSWLRLRVGIHVAMFYIHHMNWLNSHHNFVLMTVLYTLSQVLELFFLPTLCTTSRNLLLWNHWVAILPSVSHPL